MKETKEDRTMDIEAKVEIIEEMNELNRAISICTFDEQNFVHIASESAILDEYLPGWESVGDFEKECEVIKDFTELTNAFVYCRPNETFFLEEAIALAMNDGKNIIVVENLS